MDQPYLGELRAIAFGYAPKGWALCNGQLLPISQYPELFNLLGTTFGGDGKEKFGLPDLQARVPLGAGQGPGLSAYELGAAGGAEAVRLVATQLPTHYHDFTVTLQTSQVGNDSSPQQNYPAPDTSGYNQYSTGPKDTAMGTAPGVTGATSPAGGGQPHENRQPWLATYYVIATQGDILPIS